MKILIILTLLGTSFYLFLQYVVPALQLLFFGYIIDAIIPTS